MLLSETGLRHNICVFCVQFLNKTGMILFPSSKKKGCSPLTHKIRKVVFDGIPDDKTQVPHT